MKEHMRLQGDTVSPDHRRGQVAHRLSLPFVSRNEGGARSSRHRGGAVVIIVVSMLATVVSVKTAPADAAFAGANGKIVFGRQSGQADYYLYTMDATVEI